MERNEEGNEDAENGPRRGVAGGIGTFALTFAGAGAAIVNEVIAAPQVSAGIAAVAWRMPVGTSSPRLASPTG